ncbi:hypothetical protein LTR66_011092 [Elasticomyces elasticus]|nr:hypothetical protein LTR66_011092 [Elasticomyces elasticus]
MDSANESGSLQHLDFSQFNDLSSFGHHHNYEGLDELLDSTAFDIAYQQPTLEAGSDVQLIDFDNILSTCPGGTGWDATNVPQVADDSAPITGDPPTDPATQPRDMSALTTLKDEVAELRQQLAAAMAYVSNDLVHLHSSH